ncbi:MAG: hypothetical protein AAF291_11615 [Pseudomonadota bacterium]
MKTQALLGVGAGLAALAALPGHTQTSSASTLEAACRATEVTMPDSCPCTVTKARAAGVSDTQLASLFKDDGHSSPVPQAKYSAFWQVKSQCIADSMMASLGVSQGNPLPGLPAHMRPKMPGQTAAPIAPTPALRAAPQPSQRPAPATASAPAPAGKPKLAQARANIAALRGNAYEYVEDGGRRHRYDFPADSDLVIYQAYDPSARPQFQRSAEVNALSAQMSRFGPQYVLRDVASGTFSTFSLLSVASDHFVFNKAYVRTAEEWKFRKVGAAKAEFPAEGPQPLEDGFWQPPFRLKLDKTNPFFNQNFALAGWTNAANREAYQEGFAGDQGLIQIKYTDDPTCNHNCVLIANDFDQRNRRFRERVVELTGVDAIGVRLEETPYRSSNISPPNRVSLRGFDGYGGYTEWLCTRDGRLTCRETAKVAPKSTVASAGGGISARLGSIAGEAVGEAQCFQELYRAPANGAPTTLAGMLRLSRTGQDARFATATDIVGTMDGGMKINLDGRDVVLSPTGAPGVYSGGNVTMTLGQRGQTITDNPAYGYSPLSVIISVSGASETFDAVDFGGC